MRKLYEKSKQQVLNKLKYINDIMSMIADMLKSFATIIGSLVAGTTAGVTGYYEVKKMVNKNHVAPQAKDAKTTATAEVSSKPVELGYQLDMNTGAFLMSIIMFAVLTIAKIKKKT